MENGNNFNDLDFDYRDLTPDQWVALRERLIQRFQQERAEYIRRAFRALLSWLCHAIAGAWMAFFAPTRQASLGKRDYTRRNSRSAPVKRTG